MPGWSAADPGNEQLINQPAERATAIKNLFVRQRVLVALPPASGLEFNVIVLAHPQAYAFATLAALNRIAARPDHFCHTFCAACRASRARIATNARSTSAAVSTNRLTVVRSLERR